MHKPQIARLWILQRYRAGDKIGYHGWKDPMYDHYNPWEQKVQWFVVKKLKYNEGKLFNCCLFST